MKLLSTLPLLLGVFLLPSFAVSSEKPVQNTALASTAPEPAIKAKNINFTEFSVLLLDKGVRHGFDLTVEDSMRTFSVDMTSVDLASLTTAFKGVPTIEIEVVDDFIVFRSRDISKIPNVVHSQKTFDISLKDQTAGAWLSTIKTPESCSPPALEQSDEGPKMTVDVKDVTFDKAMCVLSDKYGATSWYVYTCPLRIKNKTFSTTTVSFLKPAKKPLPAH